MQFTETFSNNAADWELDSNWNRPGLFSNFRDGTYRIEYPTTCATCFWSVIPGYNNLALAPIFGSDYVLTIDVWNVTSSNNKGYSVGLVWHVQPQENGYYRKYYTVRYSDNGRWDFVRRTGEETTTLASGTGMAVNFNDGAVHKLQLHVRGETVTLRVDGVPVGTMTDASSILPLSGRAGFLVGNPVGGRNPVGTVFSASFDNLTVVAD